MSALAIVPGLWQVPLDFDNAFLLDTDDGLTLIDTGMPDGVPELLAAVREIGRTPGDVRRVLVTHAHSDHAGSLAGVKRETGAPAFMHRDDAELVRRGRSLRPLTPAPGLVNWLVCKFVLPDVPGVIEPTEVEHELADGDTLPGGLRSFHAPGHCAGRLAFLWPRHGGVLVAADAAAIVFGLSPSPLYEDVAEGRRSLSKLSALDFEVAVFGHGKPILSGASARFRSRWPAARASTPQPT